MKEFLGGVLWAHGLPADPELGGDAILLRMSKSPWCINQWTSCKKCGPLLIFMGKGELLVEVSYWEK